MLRGPSAAIAAIVAATWALPVSAEIPIPPKPGNPDINAPTQPRLGAFTGHIDQDLYIKLIEGGQPVRAFEIAAGRGDDFFDNLFVADQIFSAGANVGQGMRFTRAPRADLSRPGEWATHFPPRSTGPNGQSCIECHIVPSHDGAGFVSGNVIRDPLHTGDPGSFIQRNSPHLFGVGAVQLLAEEMTSELQTILGDARAVACRPGNNLPVTRNLVTRGIDYGRITVQQTLSGSTSRCNIITSEVRGVDRDLVIKPFQWKGSVATVREFSRDASNNELGLQAVELVGADVDGDGDGVANELSVGDITTLTVYVAAQPRPSSLVELGTWGRFPQLPVAQILSIDRGRRKFEEVGCAVCHVPELKLRNPTFTEPSQSRFYREDTFPAGQDPVAAGLDPLRPVHFDLTKNVIEEFPVFEKDENGFTRVQLFGDLRRHDLGPEDAESIDETGTGNSVWLTRTLWGLGSTAPYMHDGRATDVPQAVRFHGGEAAGSRALFDALPASGQRDIINFLINLRLFKAG